MTDEQQQTGISPGRAVWWGVRFIGWGIGAFFGFWIILFAVASIIAGIATLAVPDKPFDPFDPVNRCDYFDRGNLRHGYREQDGTPGAGQCSPLPKEYIPHADHRFGN
jgi:hypothetical protein